jgi:hypothetical protein
MAQWRVLATSARRLQPAVFRTTVGAANVIVLMQVRPYVLAPMSLGRPSSLTAGALAVERLSSSS